MPAPIATRPKPLTRQPWISGCGGRRRVQRGERPIRAHAGAFADPARAESLRSPGHLSPGLEAADVAIIDHAALPTEVAQICRSNGRPLGACRAVPLFQGSARLEPTARRT